MFEKILIGIGVLGFFLILLITNPSLAIYLLFSILSGGRGGGGGGGGFSGGGGQVRRRRRLRVVVGRHPCRS